MKYQRLSTRQNLAMTWWNRPGFEVYDGIICDGSIRSGKTVATRSWSAWLMACMCPPSLWTHRRPLSLRSSAAMTATV